MSIKNKNLPFAELQEKKPVQHGLFTRMLFPNTKKATTHHFKMGQMLTKNLPCNTGLEFDISPKSSANFEMYIRGITTQV